MTSLKNVSLLVVALIVSIIFILFCYVYFIYRWSGDRIASICTNKFLILDAMNDMKIDKYGSDKAFVFADGKSVNVANDKKSVSCVVEIRDKITQIPFEKISVQYKIVREHNQADCPVVAPCIVV